jgi:hypothetical protein
LLALCLAAAGCGSSKGADGTQASAPAYVTEPPTHQQLLVEEGARLVVADGCSACHLNGSSQRVAPNFASFAGNEVTLLSGRRVLVDESFLREALSDPRATFIRGYRPAPMLAALARLRLAEHPHQIAALAAYIEQIGPEPE